MWREGSAGVCVCARYVGACCVRGGCACWRGVPLSRHTVCDLLPILRLLPLQIVIGGTNQNTESQRIRKTPPQILVATPGARFDPCLHTN